MKARINLTVEEEVLKKAKYYAEEHHTSVSEMVETYLKSITDKNRGKKSLIEATKSLKRPKGKYDGRDLVKEFYEVKGKGNA